jgi:hypothetical protein
VKVRVAGRIDRPFLAQFRPSLTEVSHVVWRGALLEMTDGTNGGAQRAHSLRPRCVREVDPETTTHICLTWCWVPDGGAFSDYGSWGCLQFFGQAPLFRRSVLPAFLHRVHKGKRQTGKAIPLQPMTGSEGSRMLRLPDFKTVGMWKW